MRRPPRCDLDGSFRIVARYVDGDRAVVLWEVETDLGAVGLCDHIRLRGGLLDVLDRYVRPPDPTQLDATATFRRH